MKCVAGDLQDERAGPENFATVDVVVVSGVALVAPVLRLKLL